MRLMTKKYGQGGSIGSLGGNDGHTVVGCLSEERQETEGSLLDRFQDEVLQLDRASDQEQCLDR
jgi:hypothetical protein